MQTKHTERDKNDPDAAAQLDDWGEEDIIDLNAPAAPRVPKEPQAPVATKSTPTDSTSTASDDATPDTARSASVGSAPTASDHIQSTTKEETTATMSTKKSKKLDRAAKRQERQEQREKTPRSKKRFFLLLIPCVVFSALLIFAGVKVFGWHTDNVETQEQQEEASAIAEGHEVEAEGELVNPPAEAEVVQDEDYWYYTKLPFYEANFDQLKAINPDTVAFIHMNNNNINYPVVQTTDNEYYLTHAFKKTDNDAGWVFMDYRSNLSSSSKNTVIYGHGRYNGTVFGSLQEALDPAWQANRDNYVISLSTPTENLMYQIFSIYTIKAETYYIKHYFTADEWSEWVKTMASRNVAPITTPVAENDHILTLSTCKDDFDNRIVVQAKLIKRQAR